MPLVEDDTYCPDVMKQISAAQGLLEGASRIMLRRKVVHYGEAEEAFASEDPFVRQFLAGESAGPLGMD